RIGHDALECPMADLASVEAEEESLLVAGETCQQGTEQATLLRSSTFAAHAGHLVEDGVHLEQLDGGLRRSGVAARITQGSPADAESLRDGATHVRRRDLDLVRRGTGEEVGEEAHLIPASRGVGHSPGGLYELGKLHGGGAEG